MMRQPMAEAMQVAVITAPKSIPACAMTAGWTKMMYEAVRNVTKPARTSVPTVLWFSLMLKNRSRVF